ncbi:MAG: hypothetical protein R2741_02475 [Methanolobus sp.]
MRRRGYISKVGNVKPARYKLTKKGRVHAQDPFIQKKRKQELLQHRVSAILNDDEKFREALEVEIQNRMKTPQSLSGGPVSQPTESINDSEVIKIIRDKDDQIAKLQMQLQQIRRQSQPAGPVRQAQRTKSPEKLKEENARIKKRKKLAELYASRNRLLDAAFFTKWGDLRPYKIKFKGWFSANSIEILSPSNPEIRRGHAHKHPLSPRDIPAAKFHIVDMNEKGITIRGRGLPDGKARMSF